MSLQHENLKIRGLKETRTSRSMGRTETDMSTVLQIALTASAIEVAAREQRIMKAMKMKNLPVRLG